MTTENLFKTAVKEKMRFPYKGQISVEELYDLAPQELDKVFKTLNSQLKQVTEESLLQVKTAADKELDVKIQLVKYIVKEKLEEAQSKLEAKERKEKKQKIMQVLAAKQEESLQNKSPEELQAMLEELDN